VQNGGKQGARVFVLGVLEQVGRAASFDDAALEDHADLVAQMVDHREVVTDEEIADAELLLQVLHEVEHLGLHGYVERTHRLVGDDELGARDEGACDGDALALSARELVRVLVHVCCAQADRCQCFGSAFALHGAAGFGQRFERLGDDARHGLARVERAVGVLEHHLEIAPRGAQLGLGQRMQIATFEAHAARGGRVERHHEARDGRLARARFTDDAHALAGLHLEAHAVERLDGGRRAEELFSRQRVVAHEIGDLQQRWSGGRAHGAMAPSVAISSSRMQRTA
jgi:hypothetical protein